MTSRPIYISDYKNYKRVHFSVRIGGVDIDILFMRFEE